MVNWFDVKSFNDIVEIALKEMYFNWKRRKAYNNNNNKNKNNKVTMNNDNNNSITL